MNNRAEIYKSKVNINNNSSPRVMEINYMSDSPTVLDVGCACGDLGVALKEYKNATVFGMEYNQDSIDIALKTNAYEEIHQINLDELKIDDYKQYKNKFDYIVCGDVLEHLRYPMNTLNILKNYLKEGGYIITSIPNVAHMSIKSNLLVNDFTYTPSGLLDETHIHLFTHKSIASGLSSNGLKIDDCSFTLRNKLGWQPNDPYNELSDDIKDYLFKDWHSYVCQYVMKISVSTMSNEQLQQHNASKLVINEQNAPDYIKKYRNELLQELTNTTSQKLDSLSKNINDMQNVFAKKSDLDKIYNEIRNEKDLQNEIKSLNKKIEKLKQRRLYYKILLYDVIFVFLMYLILK